MSISIYQLSKTKQTLTELRSSLRGVSFDKERYLDQLKTVDSIIIMCTLVDAFEQQ